MSSIFHPPTISGNTVSLMVKDSFVLMVGQQLTITVPDGYEIVRTEES
jgi:hypothetical protein